MSGGSGSVHSLNKGRDNDQAKGYWYGDGHLVNTTLHLSLLTAAKLGAGSSSVWREAASSYLEIFKMFSFYNFG